MANLLVLPRALVSILYFTLNTVLWSLFLYGFAVLRIFPNENFRRWCTKRMIDIAERWIAGNVFALKWFSPLVWDLRGLEGLAGNRSYLVIANHQSWVDIVMLQGAFNRRIPFVRFFLKEQLKWVPILGIAWRALDFPFMKRHSKEHLEKYPEKRGEDLATTKRACERFRGSPITVLNFLEGTRFTASKHERQKSPYRHLLLPKAGGVAFVLECMGDQFDAILDVTIVYPDGAPSMWDLFAGRLRRVVLRVESLPVPNEIVNGNYIADSASRASTQTWVRGLWERKDRLIDQLITG